MYFITCIKIRNPTACLPNTPIDKTGMYPKKLTENTRARNPQTLSLPDYTNKTAQPTACLSNTPIDKTGMYPKKHTKNH